MLKSISKAIRRAWRKLTGNWWIVKRTTWPYRPYYAAYNPAKRTVFDGYRTREDSQEECDLLNNVDKEQQHAAEGKNAKQ